MTAGVLTFAILGPLTETLERFLPLDAGLINVNNPSEALVLALAGSLSTSAFVFPALKELQWEELDSGRVRQECERSSCARPFIRSAV